MTTQQPRRNFLNPDNAIDPEPVPLHERSLEEVVYAGLSAKDREGGTRRFAIKSFPSVLDAGFDGLLTDPDLDVRAISLRHRLITKLGVEVLNQMPSVASFRQEHQRIMSEFHPTRSIVFRKNTAYALRTPSLILSSNRVDLAAVSWVADAMEDLRRSLALPMSTVGVLVVLAAFTKSERLIHRDIKRYCEEELAHFQSWSERTRQEKAADILKWEQELSMGVGMRLS